MRIELRPLSLRRRIVASVALGLALVLLLFGLVVLWTIQESREAAYRERVTLARVLVSRVDDALRSALVALEHEGVDLTIEPGRPLAEDRRHRLDDVRLQLGASTLLSVVDAEGVVVWSDPPGPGDPAGSLLDHPGLELALRSGELQVTELPSPVEREQLFACLAVPLRDASGRITGALMARLDLSRPALNLLPSSEVGDGLRVQMVDSSGHLPATDQGLSLTEAEQHQSLLVDLVAARTPGYRIHEPLPPATSSSHVVAYAPVPLLPSLGVVVEQPRDVVLAMPRRLQQRLILLGFVALLVTAAVAWLDVRRVVRPLKHLTVAAERFAAGNLDEPVQLDRADELGILARAFETMRRRLRASLAEVAEWNRELERRVAARTAEVERRNRELAHLNAERAELLQRVMDGQEEERRRLAQELHDDTSQTLATLRLGLERLAAGIEKPPHAKRLADQLQGVAAQTLSEVHRLALELRPSVLDDIGLVAAIGRYLREYARRWDLAVDLAPVGVEGFRLIPAAETAIYRIVQAGLTNIAQHARARHVSVLIERREGKLVVVVEDDGRGFDLATVRSAPLEGRLGLAGMEERAALIGATLTIETAPNSGTTVFLEVPLDSNCRMEEADVEGAHTAG